MFTYDIVNCYIVMYLVILFRVLLFTWRSFVTSIF